MNDLADQTVLVVGASSGIGLATCKATAARGAAVVMLSRSAAKLSTAASEIDGAVRTVAADMLDRHSLQRELESLATIDHLVLTAVADERACIGRIGDLTVEQVERSFDKLRGFVNVLSVARSKMSARGSITLLSGASAVKPSEGFAVLSAAAGSIVSLARTLTIELAPIRVNVVMPGVVDTPIHDGHRNDIQAWAESKLPVRYFGQPGDLAEAIVFLMMNRYVTGHTLVVDGGLTAS